MTQEEMNEIDKEFVSQLIKPIAAPSRFAAVRGWMERLVRFWSGTKTNSREAALIARIEELESASFVEVSSDIARMVTAYVEGGIKGGTDWRNGLPEIIAARLKRLQLRRGAAAPASPESNVRDMPNLPAQKASQ